MSADCPTCNRHHRHLKWCREWKPRRASAIHRAEVSLLRAALEEIAAMGCKNTEWFVGGHIATCIDRNLPSCHRCLPCIARAALDVTRG